MRSQLQARGTRILSEYVFEAELWEWSGKGSWHFMTVPVDVSGIIKMSLDRRAGFGSVRVEADLSGIYWKTSLFPAARSGSFLLPVKADVRRRAGLKTGSIYAVALSVIVLPISRRSAP